MPNNPPCPVPSGKAAARVSKNRAKQVTQPSRTKVVTRPQLNIGPGDMLKGWVKKNQSQLEIKSDLIELMDRQSWTSFLYH